MTAVLLEESKFIYLLAAEGDEPNTDFPAKVSVMSPGVVSIGDDLIR